MGEKGNLLVLPLSTISTIWPKVTHGASVVIIAACTKQNIENMELEIEINFLLYGECPWGSVP